MRHRRTRRGRLAVALVVGLLAGGLAACSSAADHAVDIQDGTRTANSAFQPTRGVARGNISLREVFGETLSMPTSSAAAAIELQFLGLTNAARAAVNVAPVSLDPDLQAYARVHVRAMADNGRIYHSNIASLLGPWWMVGENVGTGPDAAAIEAAYERSPSHYQNITERNFKYIGVGVVVGPGGRIYTSENYGI